MLFPRGGAVPAAVAPAAIRSLKQVYEEMERRE